MCNCGKRGGAGKITVNPTFYAQRQRPAAAAAPAVRQRLDVGVSVPAAAAVRPSYPVARPAVVSRPSVVPRAVGTGTPLGLASRVTYQRSGRIIPGLRLRR
jgi:hypothetical protein